MPSKRKRRRKMRSKREERNIEEKKEEAADTVDYANEKVPLTSGLMRKALRREKSDKLSDKLTQLVA